MNSETRSMVSTNPFLMETLAKMQMDQEPSERFHYLDIATEAIVSTSQRGAMIQKLYTDIVKKSDLDFGKIGDSHGILTKYTFYDRMMGAAEGLQQIAEGQITPAMKTFQTLHDIVIAAGKDFEMGYKFNIEFIQLTYKVLVLTLHELLDVAVCDTVDYLRDVVNVEYRNNSKALAKHNRMIIQYAQQFIDSYNKGEWERMMKEFRGNREGLIGTIATIAAVSLLTIAGVMAGIRLLIYYFYYTKTTIADHAKMNADVLRKKIEIDNDKNSSAIQKQQKMLDFLEGKKSVIESRLNKSEDVASRAMSVSNKTEFSARALNETETAGDFELL